MAKSKGPEGAILQRDGETYAIVPRTPLGMLTPEILDRINSVVKKWDIPIVKVTSGQRIALVGIKEEDVDPIWEDLGRDIGRATELCVHYVQACPGTAVCRLGVQDSLGMGAELEKRYIGVDFPAKVKMGVSGCPLCCAESKVRDIGVVGKRDGYEVYMGGFAGNKPRVADPLAKGLSAEETLGVVDKVLKYYAENGRKRERTNKFVARVGIDTIKKDCGIE